MDRSDILLHLLNFLAPALGLALLLPLLARLFVKKQVLLLPWWAQVLLNFLVGAAVLALALWWLGRDGKMMAYAALVLALATSQWVWVRGWRR